MNEIFMSSVLLIILYLKDGKEEKIISTSSNEVNHDLDKIDYILENFRRNQFITTGRDVRINEDYVHELLKEISHFKNNILIYSINPGIKIEKLKIPAQIVSQTTNKFCGVVHFDSFDQVARCFKRLTAVITFGLQPGGTIGNVDFLSTKCLYIYVYTNRLSETEVRDQITDQVGYLYKYDYKNIIFMGVDSIRSVKSSDKMCDDSFTFETVRTFELKNGTNLYHSDNLNQNNTVEDNQTNIQSRNWKRKLEKIIVAFDKISYVNCQFTYCLLEGAYPKMIDDLVKEMGFLNTTVKILDSNQFYFNYSFDLEDGCDITKGFYFMRPYTNDHYIHSRKFHFLVPEAPLMRPWKTFLMTFSAKLWVLCIFAFFIVSTVWWIFLIFWCLKSDIRNFQLEEIFINIFGSNLGMGLPSVPKTIKFRILLICWIFYTIHFGLFFGGNYYDMLVTPPHEEQIKTVEEAVKKNMKIFVPLDYYDSGFFADIPKAIPIFMEDFNNSILTDLNSTLLIEDFTYTARWVSSELASLVENSVPLTKIKDLNYLFLLTARVHVKKAYLGIFNRLIPRALASGSLVHFERSYINDNKNELLSPTDQSDVFSLRFEHIAVPIAILVFVSVLQIFTLMLEVFKTWLWKK